MNGNLGEFIRLQLEDVEEQQTQVASEESQLYGFCAMLSHEMAGDLLTMAKVDGKTSPLFKKLMAEKIEHTSMHLSLKLYSARKLAETELQPEEKVEKES